MRIAGILPCSFVNGEGARYVIFLQGCKHHCKGCQNPETWDFDGGKEIGEKEIAEDFRNRKLLDGITLSGGDPFNVKPVLNLSIYWMVSMCGFILALSMMKYRKPNLLKRQMCWLSVSLLRT